MIGLIGIVICVLFCKKDPPPPPPPSIDCYDPWLGIYYAKEGETTATVTWDIPSSPNGDVKKIAGPDPGTAFSEGEHKVTYVASSDSGQSEACSLSFYVKVYKCNTPSHPQNGRVLCGRSPPIYGDHCKFECNEGYKGTGSQSPKCQKNGSIRTDFVCRKISCGKPHQPDNAVESCHDGHVYNSICTFPCKDGFQRDGGDAFTTCTINGKWSTKVADCKDAVPPEIQNCPSDFTTYVGPDQIHAVIEYTPPTATDNIDVFVDVKLEEGPDAGARVAIDRSNPDKNRHTVKYTAFDSGGLEAILPCRFTVTVADLTCDPLPSQPKMNTTCTEPLYIYGSRCHFSCFSGYPLEGLQTVRCEKHPGKNEVYWDWGVGNDPTKCVVKDCPDPDPPINGAMSCVPVASGKHCVMSCNEKYDIPRTAPTSGTFFCDDAQGWLGNDDVPDCTELRRGNKYNLPVEFYYKGDCNSGDVQEKIKERVISITLNSTYKSLCEREEDCKVENVNVTCGKTTLKRSLGTITVTFEFSVAYHYKKEIPIKDQYDKLEETVYNMFDLFEVDMGKGALDIVELNLAADPSTLAHGVDNLICPPGLKPEYSTLTCLSCPTGTMYNSDIDDCMKCPIGTYQETDGQFSCLPCPDGFSTERIGSKHLDNCTEMCPPGSVSDYGILPCYKCKRGTYQDKRGQVNCIECPIGTNSTIQGSTSLLNCTSDNEECLKKGICGDHGICVPDFDTEDEYQCVCVDGYTGDNCSIPPHPCLFHACQNGGDCIANGMNYTCQCRPGYTGHYCELQIDNGGWTDFEKWSPCPQTCGFATQIRVRFCTAPKPQNGGLDCTGKAVEERICELPPCPECPSPLRPYLGEVNETITDGVHTAVIYCPHNGYILSGEPSEFECGNHTNYIWDPFVTKREMPKCIEVSPAEALSTEAKFEYPNIPNEEGSVDKVLQKTEEMLDQTTCVVSNTCGLSVGVEEAPSYRKKRKTEFNLVVTIRMNATMDYGAYFKDGVLQMEIVNATLPDYLTKMTDMELSAQEIENATKDDNLAVVIGGQIYLPDPDTFTVIGNLDCPDGRQAQSGFCVTCPPGSRETNGECVLCQVGTYQDQDGQTSCIPCPTGHTTEYIGAVDVDMCTFDTGIGYPDSENTSPSSSFLNQQSQQLIFLTFLMVPCIALVVAAAIFYFKKGGKVAAEKPRETEGNMSESLDGYSQRGKGVSDAPPSYNSVMPLTPRNVVLKS